MILNNVQAIRWERNLSLRELSALSGVSHTEIDLIENGRRHPNHLLILRICKAFDLEVHEVFNMNWRELDLDSL
jgi:DNA-binding XRE family transcriptional regulator